MAALTRSREAGRKEDEEDWLGSAQRESRGQSPSCPHRLRGPVEKLYELDTVRGPGQCRAKAASGRRRTEPRRRRRAASHTGRARRASWRECSSRFQRSAVPGARLRERERLSSGPTTRRATTTAGLGLATSLRCCTSTAKLVPVLSSSTLRPPSTPRARPLSGPLKLLPPASTSQLSAPRSPSVRPRGCSDIAHKLTRSPGAQGSSCRRDRST